VQTIKKDGEVLRFLITEYGVTLDGEKMQSVLRLKIPQSREELHTFLGLLVYYSTHIPDYALKTKPLWDLMKGKSSFSMSAAGLESIKLLKQDLISPTLLHFPDWELPFELHTDASRIPGALGAVLLQRSREQDSKERVIGYYSRLLHGAEKNYSITELECLAVRWALEKLRAYLMAAPFIVVTDHIALKWLFSMKQPNQRLQRWIAFMQSGYKFDIVYRQGKKHQNADAFSQVGC